MEMVDEFAHSMFKVSSILSLIFVGWGDVLAPGGPLKEMNTWKGKI